MQQDDEDEERRRCKEHRGRVAGYTDPVRDRVEPVPPGRQGEQDERVPVELVAPDALEAGLVRDPRVLGNPGERHGPAGHRDPDLHGLLLGRVVAEINLITIR